MSDTIKLRCAALLFDLDGVLVDSSECVEGIWRRWATGRGLDPERVIQLAHGRRTIETVELLASPLEVAAELAALAASESATTAGVHEVPGARKLLAALPTTAWAVVTSAVRAVATLRMRLTGLPLPPVLVCADDVERGKPDPQGYLLAAARLGFPASDCIVVEDTPPGIEAAHAAVMRVIAVAGTYPRHALSEADVTASSLAAIGVAIFPGQSVLKLSVCGEEEKHAR